MAVQDFYKVLKVNRNASKNEIKEAYRKMALMLHPDRHDGCEIKSEEFKKATEAYQTLSGES
jgi:molecular chaperone DnaJ